MKSKFLKPVSVFSALLLFVSNQSSADVLSELAACRNVEDSLRRLVCYDGIELEEGASTPSETETVGQGPEEIARFEGTGTRTTRPFRATGPFAVRAWSKGTPISVVVQSTTSEWDLHVLSMTGSGPEETFVPKGGKYVLEMMAFSGAWEVVVLDAD